MAAGFMAGFGTNFAKLMEEDRQYFRDRAAKRQDYIQTYGTRAVAEREDKANSVMAVANNLKTRGFKPSTVRYVLDNNGITGLLELQDTAAKRTDITNDEIDSIVTKAADYVSKNPDEDMNTVIKRAFGLYKSEANPVKRERNAFSAILGFDNAMLEEEVLDDIYINGYTGRDIYRIMGSAGPRAGAALQLDLPTKPLSPMDQERYARLLLDQMETGINARSSILKTQIADEETPSDEKKKLQEELNYLETLKGRGLVGLSDYANLKGSELFEYAKYLNEEVPGSVLGNSTLYMFQDAFKEHLEGKQPKPKPKPKPGPKVMTFNTTEEFNKAVETGEVTAGQQVKIGNDPVLTFSPPPGTTPPSDTKPKTTDLGDMTGAPGFRERDEAFRRSGLDDLQSDITQSVFGFSVEPLLDLIPDMPGYPTKEEVENRLIKPPVEDESEAEMEERIRDDARQFLQDEKSFPQPLPTVVIEKVMDKAVEEAKVDRIIVANLDMKGKAPSREDFDRIKTILEQEQLIDTSTDELYRGPISGKTLVEKLDDIWNFYTSDGETEYNPRAVGTVGSRDLGLRDTTDDVRPPRGEAPERSASLARGPSPEGDDLPAETPRNMAVENFTTRGINAAPRGLMTPKREEAPKLGQAEFGDLIQRVHGSSRAAEAFNKKVSSGKLTAADVSRLLKATQKLPETTSRQRLIASLFNLRDGLNKR